MVWARASIKAFQASHATPPCALIQQPPQNLGCRKACLLTPAPASPKKEREGRKQPPHISPWFIKRKE
eukprot:966927-Pelagomonas_calceolata.AAC.2